MTRQAVDDRIDVRHLPDVASGVRLDLLPSLAAWVLVKAATALSVSQPLSRTHASDASVADDFAGRFVDDGGPSPAGPAEQLRLVWAAAQNPQRIRGAWWPRGHNITVELATLLPSADSHLGAPLIRVSLNSRAWDHQPRRLYAGSRVIRLGWFDSIDPAIVEIGASATERIALCVVPPEWTAVAGKKLLLALRESERWPADPTELLKCGARAPATTGSR